MLVCDIHVDDNDDDDDDDDDGGGVGGDGVFNTVRCVIYRLNLAFA